VILKISRETGQWLSRDRSFRRRKRFSAVVTFNLFVLGNSNKSWRCKYFQLLRSARKKKVTYVAISF
jgi:hypothetical protein